MSKIAIIANPKARSSAGWESCERIIAAQADMSVYMLGSAPLDTLVTEAYKRGCETIVAAGGDGTISGVADAIVRLHIPVKLGVIPTGTLNHFAKDLAIPLDITEALQVIKAGHSKEIDLGRVNEQHFINNSSIGLYPYLVSARESLERSGVHKWLALIKTLMHIMYKRFAFEATLGSGDSALQKNVSSIFVGNNTYTVQGFDIGSRQRLDEGKLFVAFIKELRAFEYFRLFITVLFGSIGKSSDLDVIGLRECVISGTHAYIDVAYDGEVKSMIQPLRYSVVPLALRVIVPHI